MNPYLAHLDVHQRPKKFDRPHKRFGKRQSPYTTVANRSNDESSNVVHVNKITNGDVSALPIDPEAINLQHQQQDQPARPTLLQNAFLINDISMSTPSI